MGKKLLYAIPAIILCFCLFVSVQAYTVEDNGNKIELPLETYVSNNNIQKYILYTDSSNRYFIAYTLDADAKFTMHPSGLLYCKNSKGSACTLNTVQYLEGYKDFGSLNVNDNGVTIVSLDKIKTSSIDIYDYNDPDKVVFQHPPVPDRTLVEALEENSPVEKFQTMMSGMIKYLLLFLIGLVAFWKGWQMLSKELRRA